MDNLLDSDWIPVRRRDGTAALIRPADITSDIATNPIVDIESPRPDFRAALYQFLIGLLQSCCEEVCNDADWEALYDAPPTPERLSAWFEPVADAFKVAGSGPQFMQDPSVAGEAGRPISELLIGTPTGKTLKDNTDHFVKRSNAGGMALVSAVTALLTLQINAPAGGAGYRTGLRGGGPLTTLLLAPDEELAGEPVAPALWSSLWLNVLARPDHLLSSGNPKRNAMADRFPWMGAVRVSDKRGVATTPDDAHPDQMYWSLPRRVWLHESQQAGHCSVSGEACEALVESYSGKNYGVNYTGGWVHSLSPHARNKDGLMLPLHPQPGGIGYRHWASLALGVDDKRAARVVTQFHHRDLGMPCRLWAFGADFDNMKVRAWYESTLPIYSLRGRSRQLVELTVPDLIEAAEQCAYALRTAVKDAWFSAGQTLRGDLSMVTQSFWDRTEPDFYLRLQQLVTTAGAQADERASVLSQPVRLRWCQDLSRAAEELFGQFNLRAGIEHADPERITGARKRLRKFLYGKKLPTLLQLEETTHAS